MKTDDVKKTLEDYAKLVGLAEEILKTGGVKFGGIESIELVNESCVGIDYWYTCCGYSDRDSEYVPIEMFADGADLTAGWDEIRRERREAEECVRAETAKIEAENERRKEIAELKRLREKYPDA